MNNKKILTAVIFMLLSLVLCKAESLPQGYGGVTIGMSVDDVKQALKNNPDFGYRGDKDVSLLPGENRVLIETDTLRYNPYSFFSRCYFQFYEDKLYIITLEVNKKKMDYHSVFVKLSEKYGNPSYLNPDKSEWSDESVIVDLEKPLTLKYTDKAVYDSIINDIQVEKSNTEKSKSQFLDGL